MFEDVHTLVQSPLGTRTDAVLVGTLAMMSIGLLNDEATFVWVDRFLTDPRLLIGKAGWELSPEQDRSALLTAHGKALLGCATRGLMIRVMVGDRTELFLCDIMPGPKTNVAVVATAHHVDARFSLLTEREKQVLRGIPFKTTAELSRELGISHNTVHAHRSRACLKLRISGSQLVAWVMRHLYALGSDAPLHSS